jgi:hypothetical protein
MFGYTLIKSKEYKRLQLIRKDAKELIVEMGNHVPDIRYRRVLITALQYHLDRLSKKDYSDLE